MRQSKPSARAPAQQKAWQAACYLHDFVPAHRVSTLMLLLRDADLAQFGPELVREDRRRSEELLEQELEPLADWLAAHPLEAANG
jgi:hypothetical protein